MNQDQDPLERINDVARRIEDEVRRRLGDAWTRKLTKLDVATVRACCRDAADLQVRALAAATYEERQKLLQEKVWINAQLCNLVAVRGTEVADVFWDILHVVVNGAVAVAFAAI
jgi:hypothetical protein